MHTSKRYCLSECEERKRRMSFSQDPTTKSENLNENKNVADHTTFLHVDLHIPRTHHSHNPTTKQLCTTTA
eukprot:m.147459 g.147459  ORF g.147459 m.147459 type:complete len:71 (+) comp30538_c2_seq2:400-612(+)